MSSFVDYIEWQKNYKKKNVTANMLRWQNNWGESCGMVCCYSSNCGSIRCSFCYKSLTKEVPVVNKYICMNCEVIEEKKDPMTLCEDCFNSSEFLHDHKHFCMVDGEGNHSNVERQIGFSLPKPIDFDKSLKYIKFLTPEENNEEHEIQKKDEIIVIKNAQDIPQECGVCFEDEDIRFVSTIGCEKGHSLSHFDKKKGYVETNMYSCFDCMKSFMIANEQNKYYGNSVPNFCRICLFKLELIQWEKDFDIAFSKLFSFLKSSSQHNNNNNNNSNRPTFYSLQSVESQLHKLSKDVEMKVIPSSEWFLEIHKNLESNNNDSINNGSQEDYLVNGKQAFMYLRDSFNKLHLQTFLQEISNSLFEKYSLLYTKILSYNNGLS
eukprot:TRINITY_DN5501_c0_g1_i1.p1 TRINITY_DN5501_c0_g1~~TRINITY_DN5501_c0_g1_i1.p1  ORF type:complete len:379 (+),score=75.03 TRINITY_DN5501_c0_g1_i1:57-1193(+)